MLTLILNSLLLTIGLIGWLDGLSKALWVFQCIPIVLYSTIKMEEDSIFPLFYPRVIVIDYPSVILDPTI